VEKNQAESVKWYRQSAEQGNAYAQLQLGLLYNLGDSIVEDTVEAAKWLEKAAEQEITLAYSALGEIYKYGGPQIEDLSKALFWYQKAYKSGDTFALKEISSLIISTENSEISLNWFLDLKSPYSENPEDKFERLLNLVVALGINGEYEVIIDTLSSINNDISLEMKYLPELRLMLAATYVELNENEQAKQLLKPLLNKKINTNGFRIHYLLLMLEIHKKDKNIYEGRKLARLILEQEEYLFPKNIDLGTYWKALSSAHFVLGDIPKATEFLYKLLDYRRSLEINKNQFDYNYLSDLAMSFYEVGSLDFSKNLSNEVMDYFLFRNKNNSNLSVIYKRFFHFYISTTLIKDGYMKSSISSKLFPKEFNKSFYAVQFFNGNKASEAVRFMISRPINKFGNNSKLIHQHQDLINEYNLAVDQKLEKLPKTNLMNEYGKGSENSVTLFKNAIENVEQELSILAPAYLSIINSGPLNLLDVQSLLSPNEALFTFISEEETEATYAFLVHKDDARAYKIDLSEDQLGEMVAALRSDIDLSGVENIAALPEFDLDLAHDLYSKLLGPAADMLEGVEHLLVVPTGPMESLPFNLLVTEPPVSEGSDFDRYQAAAWLPKRFSVTRLPSVSSLRALRVFATNTQATEPFKGFGDPILDGAAGEVRGLKIVDVYEGVQANTDKVRGLPELPETSGELRLIAKYLNSSEDNLYLRERATETELKSADLSNSRVLGFATHGLVGGELNGLAEPALVLTPPAEGSDLDDGLLMASEVAQLKLNADMVLLSACNTASGENLGAEGLSGLARAFIYAGARSLLVSHWSVDSGSAAELTTGLFEALDANPEMGRAEALQSSMMSLASDSENPHYSHPAFWAPFSLIGEGAALN
ncbi:CHAT domain-containing protein, partial [bacterium]|nr:CHAT domain-containing protein [bacterium]